MAILPVTNFPNSLSRLPGFWPTSGLDDAFAAYPNGKCGFSAARKIHKTQGQYQYLPVATMRGGGGGGGGISAGLLSLSLVPTTTSSRIQ